MSTTEEYYMNKVLSLARQAEGNTSPNPMVGAVILDKFGNFAGEGYHQKAGTPHAEVHAIKMAEHRTKDGTLFVNLEPCSHYGKMPPCTQAIIEAGLKKIVIGTKNPNPKVNGSGIKILQEAGLNVQIGVLERECLELNKFFFHWIQTKKAYITLKMAISLDGKINYKDKSQRNISGLLARTKMHELRSVHDAILVSSNTIIEDNPELTVRLCKGKNPHKIILDRNLKCDINSKVFSPENNCLLLTTQYNSGKTKFQNKENVQVINWSGNLTDLPFILGEKNILSVLTEGGQILNTNFIKNNLADEILCIVNASFLGKNGNLSVFDDMKTNFKILNLEQIEEDIYLKIMKI